MKQVLAEGWLQQECDTGQTKPKLVITNGLNDIVNAPWL
jgi:hypothetical protein